LRVMEANSKGGDSNSRGGGNTRGGGDSNSRGGGGEVDTLKINDVPGSVTEDDLWTEFGKFGSLRRIK